MKIDFNTNHSNNSVNFGALKSVKGIDKIECLVGHIGRKAGDYVIENLKANPAFENLCKNYDVYVSLLPVMKPSKTPMLVDKGMHLEISAHKCNKKGVSGLIRKKNPMIKISDYQYAVVEARHFDAAQYIIDNFINSKEGLEKDITAFLKKFTDTVK